MNCTKCGSDKVVKNGLQNGLQRFKCKCCRAVFQARKSKYTHEFKLKCIEMHLDNAGLRKIAKWQKVSHTLIIYWIRQFKHLVQEVLAEKAKTLEKTDVDIMEVDELCAYVKKNLKMAGNTSGYGLLWTETATKFVILK